MLDQALQRAILANVNPIFEKTPQGEGESFHCEVVRGASYNAAWHFHPELQITLVLQSHGYRLVGDKIAPLKPGDLVLIGPNLPHVWHQDKPRRRSDTRVHAIVIRLGEDFAGRDFLELPEMAPVRTLFQRAARGLEVTGRTRLEAARRLEKIPHLTGLARLSELLAVLDVLAHSRELKPIASAGYIPNLSTGDQERMERITSHIHEHLGEAIGRAQVARTAHLSPGAFSRFFKLRTGKTLPEYVNELRVGRACRLLANERSKVIDIALECGFANLANFNRRFRQITRVSPRDYRRLLGQSAAPAQAL
jgi:AraC-like DNA-binding protein/quercetin dioxygenase-like cupin family protein